jgi:hypothetical protein
MHNKFSFHLFHHIQTIVQLLFLCHVLIQTLEPTPMATQQFMWRPILNQLTLVHDNHLVKVQHAIEFMRNSDEGVMRELGANQTLNVSIGRCIETTKKQVRMYVPRR